MSVSQYKNIYVSLYLYIAFYICHLNCIADTKISKINLYISKSLYLYLLSLHLYSSLISTSIDLCIFSTSLQFFNLYIYRSMYIFYIFTYLYCYIYSSQYLFIYLSRNHYDCIYIFMYLYIRRSMNLLCILSSMYLQIHYKLK